MSSGVPSVTRALGAGLDGRGVCLVDCPVSGGVARAVTGELSIMAGGDADALARVAPVLAALGTSVHHCGGVGTGQAMKHTEMARFSEAIGGLELGGTPSDEAR